MGTDLLEYAYAGDILKYDKQPDGTLMVYGCATSPTVDLDGQACDPAWLQKAMPEWFKTGANIREQHNGTIAAGVGRELDHEDGDRWMLKAHVVDAGTVKKVETGVLKGFSIGVRRGEVLRGKGVTAPNGLIVGGNIAEVSLVDRHCNPDSATTICKALEIDDEWTELEPVDGMIIKGAAAIEAAKEMEGEQDSQPVDDAVDYGPDADFHEEGEDDSDPLGLFDLDEDEGAEAGGVVDGEQIEKGLIDSLLHGPKDDRKRDAHGRFGRGSSNRAAARAKERKRRAAEREANRKHHAQMDAEAAQDANHAQRQGRAMEAGEHRARLGSFAKSVVADGYELDDVDDLTSGLDYRSARTALRLVDDILSGRIDKAARKVYDEHHDIEGAEDVIAAIAELMISELEELALGRGEEWHDLTILSRAMEAMQEYCRSEKEQGGVYEDRMRRDFETIEMSVTADQPKALDAPSGDLATLVQAEITKALAQTNEAHEVELAKLRAQVDEMRQRPIPSGVMINKSVMPSAPARTENATADDQTPGYWEARAAAPGVSPEVAAAYRDKARELRKG